MGDQNSLDSQTNCLTSPAIPCGGSGPVPYGRHLSLVHGDTSRGGVIAKELYRGLMEDTILCFQEKVVLSQELEDLSNVMLVVLGIDLDIINKHNDQTMEEISENIVHKVLEDRWSIN